MNVKIDRLIKAAGFCCKWAYFKAYEDVGSSKLLKMLDENKSVTLRALQKQRERFRDEEFKCSRAETCMKRHSKDDSTS